MSRRNARENNISVPKSMPDRVKRTLKFANNLIDGQKNKISSPRRAGYVVEDARACLEKMVQGWSVRRASQLAKENGSSIPRSTLVDLFKNFFGFKANSKHKIAKSKQEHMLKRLQKFELPSYGQPQYFTKDEEELIVVALELAFERAFPWDRENLVGLVTSMFAEMPEHKGKVPTRGWIRRFEQRWSHRLDQVKTSALGKDRAEKATEEVRDKVHEKFVAMLADLKGKGFFTQEQIDNLQDHIINADEIGGNEAGTRRKVYRPKGGKGGKKKRKNAQKKARKKFWRNMQVGDDRNPFHVSIMLTTHGNGKVYIHNTQTSINSLYVHMLIITLITITQVSNDVGVLHSAPGNKEGERSYPHHKEGLHPDWFQETTTNGSMTRNSFEKWCMYLVERKAAEGYCRKDNPLILMLDGHTSRCVYALDAMD